MNQTTVSGFGLTNGTIHALCLPNKHYSDESCDAMSSSNSSYPSPDLYGVFISSVFFNCGVNPLMAIVGMFGNILTLAILRKEKKLTSIVSLQITMTICDLIFLVCLLPFSFYLCGHSVYPNLIDKITNYFPSYLLAVSTRCLTMSGRVAVAFLAIDRTIAICLPFSKVITLKRTLGVITVSNFLIFGILVHDVVFASLGHIRVLGMGGYGETNMLSVFQEGKVIQSRVNVSYKAVARTVTTILFEVIPVVTVIICNVMISRGLSSTLMLNLNGQNEKYKHKKERNAKINRTLFLITCFFVLLCLPGDVMGMVLFVYTDLRGQMIIILGYAINSLIAANHAVNFIIYGISKVYSRKDTKQYSVVRSPMNQHIVRLTNLPSPNRNDHDWSMSNL